jgi:hypothetical protein
MPDPKKKRSILDVLDETEKEVLGSSQKQPENTSMSEDEVMSFFGGETKKKKRKQQHPLLLCRKLKSSLLRKFQKVFRNQ